MPISVALWVGVAAAAAVLVRLGSSWLKYRGTRVIQCPENLRSAGVAVNAVHAAVTALGKSPELRLNRCSRWPERAGCGQECLSQIEAAPEDCLVRTIIGKWYRGKSCAGCGREFGREIDWGGSQPCLLTSNAITVEWMRIPADKLEDTLLTSKPICFACHTAAALVREHPELATDRHRAVQSHV